MLLQSRFREVGASIFIISLISTITGASSTISGAVWGSISDEHKSRKPLLMLSIIFTALSFLLFLITDNQYWLLGFVGIVSLFKSGLQPISMALATEYAIGDIKSTAKEIAYLNTSYSLGMFIGRIALAYFLIGNGPREAIIAFCIISWIPVFFALFIKEGNRTVRKKKSENIFHRLLPIVSDWSPMKKNGLWSVYVGSFLRQFGISGAMAAILIFMTENLALSYSLAVLLSSFNPLFQMFSHLMSGKFISKKGPKFSMVSGILLSSMTPICFFFANGFLFMALGYLCLGIAYGAFINGASTVISLNCPEDRKAEFMGMLASIRSFGAMLGPVFGGIIANYSFDGMFITMNVIMISGALLVFLKFKEKKAEIFIQKR
jgi:MFS family permease